jgi:hypothetical protein
MDALLSLLTHFSLSSFCVTQIIQVHTGSCQKHRFAVRSHEGSGGGGSGKLGLHPYFDIRHNWDCRTVSSTPRPLLLQRTSSGTHFFWRMSGPQGQSAAARIMSLRNSNDIIGIRTRDLPACSAAVEASLRLDV